MAVEGKIGVLLVNLGTPDSPDRSAVYRYLKQFLLDPRVIDYPWLLRQILVRGIIVPFRSGSSSKLYKMLWTKDGSPLKVYGEKLAAGVAEQLGPDYHVELAMRYQSPSIASAIDRFEAANITRLIVLPLFPHYASASTGSVHEEVMRLYSKRLVIPPIDLVNSYYDDPGMIDVFCKNGRAFGIENYDHVLFSYHGLPERHMRKGDHTGTHCQRKADCCRSIGLHNQFCYSAQCYATTYAIAEKLGLRKDQYTVCFQSRLGREEWIKPYTPVILEERVAAGDKKLLVFAPAFVSDCLETTIEVSHEYHEDFLKMGGEQLDLVPSLNDDPDWIKTVAGMVRARA